MCHFLVRELCTTAVKELCQLCFLRFTARGLCLLVPEMRVDCLVILPTPFAFKVFLKHFGCTCSASMPLRSCMFTSLSPSLGSRTSRCHLDKCPSRKNPQQATMMTYLVQNSIIACNRTIEMGLGDSKLVFAPIGPGHDGIRMSFR